MGYYSQSVNTPLGSSVSYPENPEVGWTLYGVEEAISADPKKNPMMWDWNKVVLIYCDGGSFSGRREEPWSWSASTYIFGFRRAK